MKRIQIDIPDDDYAAVEAMCGVIGTTAVQFFGDKFADARLSLIRTYQQIQAAASPSSATLSIVDVAEEP